MKAKVGMKVRGDHSEEYVVAQACASKEGGHWYCAKHGEHFPNNLSTAGHFKPRCVEVWWCHEHGPEVP